MGQVQRPAVPTLPRDHSEWAPSPHSCPESVCPCVSAWDTGALDSGASWPLLWSLWPPSGHKLLTPLTGEGCALRGCPHPTGRCKDRGLGGLDCRGGPTGLASEPRPGFALGVSEEGRAGGARAVRVPLAPPQPLLPSPPQASPLPTPTPNSYICSA